MLAGGMVGSGQLVGRGLSAQEQQQGKVAASDGEGGRGAASWDAQQGRAASVIVSKDEQLRMYIAEQFALADLADLAADRGARTSLSPPVLPMGPAAQARCRRAAMCTSRACTVSQPEQICRLAGVGRGLGLVWH